MQAITRSKLIASALSIAVLAGSGCSIRRMAVNKVGDALASGGSTFASDNDPELVKAAVPFSLKLMESLLAESPKHKGLLLAVSSGFTQYGYAFVQEEAVAIEETDVMAALEQRKRAQRLYLRARDYGLRGLEVAHPGFTNVLTADPAQAVRQLTKKDVPVAYWVAASWAAAVSVVKDNTDLFADLPRIEALIDRSLELDESYDHGAIHGLLVSYEVIRPGFTAAEQQKRAMDHFQRAVELSEGLNARPYLSLAESVAEARQDRQLFETLLRKALEIDVNQRPEWRLSNLLAQQHARWLLAHEDQFVGAEQTAEPAEQSK